MDYCSNIYFRDLSSLTPLHYRVVSMICRASLLAKSSARHVSSNTFRRLASTKVTILYTFRRLAQVALIILLKSLKETLQEVIPPKQEQLKRLVSVHAFT